jgi:hypothetical protein
VSQSTLVDSPATIANPHRRAYSRPHSCLEKADYARAFAVLEDCDTAACLPDFKEQMVEALMRPRSTTCSATWPRSPKA